MNLANLESTRSSRVELVEVEHQYPCNEDLFCKYCLIDYDIQEGDRIAIFKLGWQYIKDYIIFEWVPKNVNNNFVIFNKHWLPKTTTDIYQFCYISGENNVHGASAPFQFVDRLRNHQSLIKYSSFKFDNLREYKSLNNHTSSSLNIPDVIERDKEMLRLKEENEFLKNTLKVLVNKQSPKDYSSDIESLRKATSELQLTLSNQQNQLKDLNLQGLKWSSKYKALQKENENVDNTCDNLKKTMKKDLNLNREIELRKIPPFPLAK